MFSQLPRTDARAYGKFGRHERLQIVEASINYGWTAQEIADNWLNRHPSGKYIHLSTIYRCTPSTFCLLQR